MHRVVHVMVLNAEGDFLLQLRSKSKDVAPGLWDTSVGGHVNPGEDILEAARRELGEELGVSGTPEFLYSYVHTNRYETELVHTFFLIHDGGFDFNGEEIDEVRFWGIREIEENLGKGTFSDNFEHEISLYLKAKNKQDAP